MQALPGDCSQALWSAPIRFSLYRFDEGVKDLAARAVARYLRANVQLPVPLTPQPFDFDCGGASLFACLHYWLGENLAIDHQSDLWKALRMSPETGTEPEAMVAVAQHYGLNAVPLLDMTTDDLRICLQEGTTAILLLQAWRQRAIRWLVDWDDAHYVVLVGMDDANAYFMDPALHTSYGSVPLVQLEPRWHNQDVEGFPQHGMAVLIHGGEPAITAYPGPPQPIQ